MEKFESAAPPSPGATSRSRGSGPLSTTVRGRPWAAVAETEREVGPLSLQLAARETFDRARGSLSGPGRPGAWLACVCPELHFRLGGRDQQQQQRTSLPSVDLSFVPEEKNSSCNQGRADHAPPGLPQGRVIAGLETGLYLQLCLCSLLEGPSKELIKQPGVHVV